MHSLFSDYIYHKSTREEINNVTWKGIWLLTKKCLFVYFFPRFIKASLGCLLFDLLEICLFKIIVKWIYSGSPWFFHCPLFYGFRLTLLYDKKHWLLVKGVWRQNQIIYIFFFSKTVLMQNMKSFLSIFFSKTVWMQNIKSFFKTFSYQQL